MPRPLFVPMSRVALALLLRALAANAVGLHGDQGVPHAIAVDSADARDAAAAALRELNVRVGHYCRAQGAFASVSVRSAAQTVISDALEVELDAALDGQHDVFLGMRRGAAGKWTLVRSEPYACEVRRGAMRINDRADIEKHNAQADRTFERAAYKAFDGLTDAQITARLLARPLEPPEGAVRRIAVELEPAVAAALDAARAYTLSGTTDMEKRMRRGRASPSPSPAPASRGGSGSGSSSTQLPDAYDVRSALNGACDPSGNVRDQGSCASCWAQSNAAMLEDRLCLATAGAVRLRLSTQQHVSCDKLCWPPPHDRYCNAGCDGGFQMLAGEYAETVGLVEEPALLYTSGSSGSFEDHFTARHEQATCPANLGQHRHYRAARGSSATVRRCDVRSAQNALLNGGSLDAAMVVYNDFFTYRSGVYAWPGNSASAGGHAVKIVGYGTDRGVRYWACQNSWGSQWGERGFFRIRQGANEASIESSIVLAKPELGGALASLSTSLVGRVGAAAAGASGASGRARGGRGGGASGGGGDGGGGEEGIVILGHHYAGPPLAAARAANASVPANALRPSGGRVEVVLLQAPAGTSALSVSADGVDGLTRIDTSHLQPGVYAVRFCPPHGQCEALDEKLTVSRCAVRHGRVCGGHGVCDEGSGACSCDGGFEGPACERTCGVMPQLACGCTFRGGVWDGMPSVLQAQGRGGDMLLALTITAPTTLSLSTCLPTTDVDTVVAVYAGCPLQPHANRRRNRRRLRVVSTASDGAGGAEPLPLARADDEGCGAAAGNASTAAVLASLPPGARGGAGYGLERGSALSVRLTKGEYVVAVSGYNEHSIGGFELAVRCSAAAHSDPPGPSGAADDANAQAACPADASAAVDGSADAASPDGSPLPAACAAAPALALGSRAHGDLADSAAALAPGGTPGEALYRLTPGGPGGAGSAGQGSASMVVVSTCGSATDTEVELFRGCPHLGGHLLGASDDECGLGGFVEAAVSLRNPPRATAAALPAARASDYYVRVRGHAGARGAYTLAAHGEHVSCGRATAMRLSKPRARAAASSTDVAAEWHATISLCAAGRARSAHARTSPADDAARVEPYSASMVPDVLGAAGPDYAPGAAHASYTLTLHEPTLVDLDACGAPAGARLEVFGGCAGAPDEMPLGVADGLDGACAQAGGAQLDGGALSSRSGVRMSASLRPGLYTVVLSGARVRADELCRRFELRATTSPAPVRTWGADAAEGAGAFGGAGCVSHDDCAVIARAAGTPSFCADGLCAACETCATCADGIDNTCGECDPAAYPLREKGCERWELAAPVLRASAAAPGGPAEPPRRGRLAIASTVSPPLALAGACALLALAMAAHARGSAARSAHARQGDEAAHAHGAAGAGARGGAALL